MRLWLALGAVNGLIAVAAGAFGAHGLEGRLAARQLGVFDTAARYQMYHALALLGVAWLSAQTVTAGAARAAAISGGAFALGILLFCGSLYVTALGGPRAVAALAPVGGLLFLIGWASLGVSAWQIGRLVP